MSNSSIIDWANLRIWLHHQARQLNSNGLVNIEQVAEVLDVEVKFSDRSSRSGLLSSSKGKHMVIIRSENEALTPRARFTLAHELGHFLLLKEKGYRPAEFTDSRSYYRMEELCNYFAGKLLVPECAIDGLKMIDLDDVMCAVSKLAAICGVSRPVAAKEISDAFDDVGYMGVERIDGTDGGEVLWLVRWSFGICENRFHYRAPKKIRSGDVLFSYLSMAGQRGRSRSEFRMDSDYRGEVRRARNDDISIIGVAKCY